MFRWQKDEIDRLVDDMKAVHNPLKSIRDQEPRFYELLKQYSSMHYWIYKQGDDKR